MQGRRVGRDRGCSGLEWPTPRTIILSMTPSSPTLPFASNRAVSLHLNVAKRDTVEEGDDESDTPTSLSWPHRHHGSGQSVMEMGAQFEALLFEELEVDAMAVPEPTEEATDLRIWGMRKGSLASWCTSMRSSLR